MKASNHFVPEVVYRSVAGRAVELLGRVALLADRLGVPQSTVLAWLSGSDVPSPRLFHKMMAILQAADSQ